MFKKDENEEGGGMQSDDVETLIGPSVKIEGEFTSNANVMVAGNIHGKFSTTQNVRVEENANITADVAAQEAVIAGEITGNVTVRGHLEVLATARINGDIKAGTISIQQGAQLNGNFTMTNAEAGAEPEPQEEATPEPEHVTEGEPQV